MHSILYGQLIPDELICVIEDHTLIITSRVSGRGHRIGPVCVSVCLSVCEHSHGQTV